MRECLYVGIALFLVLYSSRAVCATTAFDTDGMITIDGKRTLIIGSYYKAQSDRPYAELAEAGFNLVRSGADRETLDKVQAAGLVAWVSIGTLDLDDRENSAAKLEEIVNGVKDHPALAFLETVDEPAWTWGKAEARVPWQRFAEAYPIIKQADPNHLLYMNHAPTNLVKTMRQYNAGTDIVACDIYPVNPGGLRPMYALWPDGHQGDLNNNQISQVGEYVDKMRRVTGPDRPLLMVLQAFAWEALRDKDQDESKVLYPTYEQSRFMAFQAIIKGANGIVYWGSHHLPQPSDAWTGIKRVTREIADLGTILATRSEAMLQQTRGCNPLSGAMPIGIDYHEMGYSVDDGIQILVKKHDGKTYLFTCNADKYPCQATLSGLAGLNTCAVLNENRTLPVEQAAITDTWPAFGVHVYALSQ